MKGIFEYQPDAVLCGIKVYVDDRAREGEFLSREVIAALNRAENRDEAGWPLRDGPEGA